MNTIMSLADLSDDGLPHGYGCRIVKDVMRRSGRTIYREAGWMWRERSSNGWYLSRDGEYEHRRYLPAETLVELVPL